MAGDSILGVHGNSLLLREKRTVILSSNLANASTPNYKARDFDFDSVLKKTLGNNDLDSVPLKSSHNKHIGIQEQLFSSELKYRIPKFPSQDGNTVDNDFENTKFAENALRYQASLTFLRNRVSGILTAIRGE